ncbi:MAG: zinc ribbon domain-containing protein [Desulfurococcales archaeon]|nr:zinc ribbon domain-containing protein [Desulfurococcales archaeon]
MTVVKILSFIKSLDIVKSYVYSDGGLVVEAQGFSKEKAEELAAWIPGLARQAEERLRLEHPVIMVLKDPEQELLVYQENDEAVIAAPEKGAASPLLKAMAGEGPRCEVCHGDLSQAVIRCPRCGAKIPFTADKCPRCGYRIDYRRCPYCGTVITATGAKAGLPRFFRKVAESFLILDDNK